MKAKIFTKETITQVGIGEKSVHQFEIGDTVAVSQWVQEGTNKRIQIFEGAVIGRKNNGASSTFTVRKVGNDGIAVEKIYPMFSAIVDSVKVISKAKVRRAKLYYLRDRIGKKSKLKERIEKRAK